MIVTVNVFADVLPDASRAVHVTVVEPSGNVDPLAGLQLTEPTPTVSAAEGAAYVTTAVPALLVVLTVRFVTTPIRGAVVSRTTTEKLVAAVLPAASDAVQDTTELPSGNTAPLAGVQDFETIPTASLPVGSA